MKKQLNQDLQKEIDQEARDSGRINPEEYAGTRVEEEKIIETPINLIDLIQDKTLDQILEEAPEDEKGNKIIPDEIFDQYVKELPAGTKNKSGTWRAANKGKIRIFGGDPEADKAIQRAGADASNAAQAHRRTLADDLKIALSKKASRQTLQELDLTDSATNQDAITAAAILQATQGNVKALQYIRDTIGEQPTTKQDLNVNMTEDDKKLLEKVEARLNS